MIIGSLVPYRSMKRKRCQFLPELHI